MSTTRKVAYNTITQVGGNILVSVLAVITLRLLTGYLGATSYGYLVVITSFVGLFGAVTDLGLSTIAGREISKEPEEASRIIGLNLSLRFIVSVVLVPIILAAGYLLYHDKNPLILNGLLILSLTLIIGSIQSSASAIFVARVRNDLTAAIGVISKILSLIGIVTVIHYSLGYYGYVWLLVAVAVISGILSLIAASRFTKLRPIFDLPAWRALLILSLPLGLIQIINMVYFYVDSILLSVLRSATEVGYYGIAYNVVTFVMMIPGYFMLALMPAMATADAERLQRVSQKAFDFLVVLAVPSFVGALLLSHYIIVAISNANFLPAVPAFVILMVGAMTSFISAVYGNAIVAVNQEKKMIRLGIYVMTINIILNLILIPHFGIAGAASATSATEIFAMFYVARLFRTITGITNQLTQALRAVFAAGVMALCWLPLRAIPYFQIKAPAQLLLLTAILATCYGIVLIAVGGLPMATIKELMGKKS